MKRNSEPLQMPGEKWRPIEGFQRYEVSNLGRVRRKDGKIMTLGKHRQGYRLAVMQTESGRFVRHVHRLVALAFIPNPDGLPVVHHRDTNTSNNAATNLQWTTQKDNIGQAMALRGNWLLKCKRKTKRIDRIDSTGKRVTFPSLRAAIDQLNRETVAATGVARPYASVAPNLCHARDDKGAAYGYRWE